MAKAVHTRIQGAGNWSAPRVVLLAFGKRGYGFGAANLAATIRHHTPQSHILLIADPQCLSQLQPFHRGLFTEISVLPADQWMTGAIPDPGKAKCHLRELLPSGPWMFIDADSIVLGDIVPMWNDLLASGKVFACETLDSGPPTKEIEYTPWASPAAIAQRAGKDGATVYGINTSWMFMADAGPFFARVAEMFDGQLWRRDELIHKWGKSMPDELIYSTACTEMGVDPSWPRSVFFGVDYSEKRLSDIADKYAMLTLYGNGRGPRTYVKRRYIDMVDPYLAKVYKALGASHIFKVQMVLNDKYLG